LTNKDSNHGKCIKNGLDHRYIVGTETWLRVKWWSHGVVTHGSWQRSITAQKWKRRISLFSFAVGRRCQKLRPRKSAQNAPFKHTTAFAIKMNLSGDSEYRCTLSNRLTIVFVMYVWLRR
jgi:hypothetical protein